MISFIENRKISREVHRNLKVTLAQLGATLRDGVTKQSIRDSLKKMNLSRPRVETSKFDLNDERDKTRFDWCLQHKYWTINDWKNVVFSNQTSIQLKTGKQTPQGARISKDSCIVWGAFSLAFGRSKLMIMSRTPAGRINTECYVKTFEEGLEPILEKAQLHTVMFQQGNVFIHTYF